jgi:uncharacterized SAM-binding protein YcdF (DUF218 family)
VNEPALSSSATAVRAPARWGWRIAAAVVVVVLAVIAGLFAEVAVYASHTDPGPADAAIVLGAAVYGKAPSPVFAERIRHGVALRKAGTVRMLVMTGGLAQGDRKSEADAARDLALAEGIAPADILVEAQSRTTEENLANALPLLQANGLSRVLLVSDGPHLRRAVALARKLGIDAHPAPTPTSRYTGWRSWSAFVAAEAYYLARCRLLGRC